jgi:methyl-accepting chemotaxis protein
MTMTKTFQILAAVTFIGTLGLTPGRPLSAAPTRPAEPLNPQESEMLSLAQELSRQATAKMERWIASKETTEERLFSHLYYAVPKTDPPKFNTDWDQLADRDFAPIQEAILARSSSIVFAVVSDRYGYVPTHNQRYSQPLTGNSASDLLNNRSKRIFTNGTSTLAVRSEGPYFLQRYAWDSTETIAEIAVPIMLRGERWGTVRLAFRAAEGR